MAKATSKASTSDRTEPQDIGGQDALGLAAAYTGLYHLFGCRVESWDVTPEGLVAHNVTFDSAFDPDRIISDINKKERRTQLFPAILSILNPDVAPPPFASNLEITTYMVNFWKGSMGENSSKVPEYVRQAAQDYKERTGTKTRRGPKVKSINLKNVREVTADTLRAANLQPDDLQYLISLATQLQSEAPASGEAEATPVPAN